MQTIVCTLYQESWVHSFLKVPIVFLPRSIWHFIPESSRVDYPFSVETELKHVHLQQNSIASGKVSVCFSFSSQVSNCQHFVRESLEELLRRPF